MKRISIILLLAVCAMQQVHAIVWNSVNIDISTEAAMNAAYGVEYATEATNQDYFKKITKHYAASELATAGIFASKYLDQKAMREVGLFGSKDENFYYQRIRTLVKDMIMPKIFSVGQLMVEHPDRALYWGPYLIKTCDDVKMLCMEFESVVTNCRCTFSDITFLVVNEKIRKILDLAKLGGVDWSHVWKDMGDMGNRITMDNIKEDLSTFVKNCESLATSGLSSVSGQWQDLSGATQDAFSGSPAKILQAVDKFKTVYDDVREQGSLKNLVLSQLNTGGKAMMSNLFSVDDYNISSMLNDYLHEMDGQYYTQVYYIYSEDKGSKVLFDYSPQSYDDRDDDRWKTSWLHFVSPKDNCYHHTLTASEKQQLLSLSEGDTQWSQSKVDAYNKSHPGHHCAITYTLKHEDRDESYKHGWGSTHHKLHCFYSYAVKVTDDWNIKNQVYSDVYDSYSMDWNSFKAKLDAKLLYYNRLEDGNTYYLGHEDKVYYTASDAAKLKGIASVSFILHCDDKTDMGQGNLSWKENGSQGSSLGEESKGFAMQTTLPSDDGTEQKIKKDIDAANDAIAGVQSQITARKRAENELYQKRYNGQMTYQQFRTGMETLEAQISTLEAQEKEMRKTLTEAQSALNEYVADQQETKDGVNRIPSVMHSLQYAYKLDWVDEGHWEDFTFVRKARIGTLDGLVTFKAVLTLARRPKYFLGIRIHRAILSVAWSLESNASSQNVVETMELDQSKTEEENSKLVNDKASEIARAHPGCTVDIEYSKVAGTDNPALDDSYHLLWVDDRLEVARKIESRLSKIYAELVMIEKYLLNEKGLLDHLKDNIWYGVSAYQRGTIATDALADWLIHAKAVGHQDKAGADTLVTSNSKHR